jgi:hypothetical protein
VLTVDPVNMSGLASASGLVTGLVSPFSVYRAHRNDVIKWRKYSVLCGVDIFSDSR